MCWCTPSIRTPFCGPACRPAVEKAISDAKPVLDVGILVRLQMEAAVRTLEQMGYEWHGDDLWKPPIGAMPARFRP